MGNAMSAVTEGNVVSYYNPALAVYQEDNSMQSAYSFLSLDRHLNFLSFTRHFDFYSSKDTSVERKPKGVSGVSVGVIQSGVSNIDGRDYEGTKTGDLSTNEYQFFLGLSNKFSSRLSMGLAVKIYYYKLYQDITASAVGLDLGVIYKYNDNLYFSLSISDLNSKYKWDTSPIYGQDGTTTDNAFPVMKKIGASYNFREIKLLTSAELEISNMDSKVFRIGAEYNIFENMFIRGGIDQIDLANSDRKALPACGFSYAKSFSGMLVSFDYAFEVEHYSASSRHIAGLSVNF